MEIEIEAEYYDGDVHISVGGERVATVRSPYDPYRASQEMILTEAVSEWFRDLEKARQWVADERTRGAS